MSINSCSRCGIPIQRNLNLCDSCYQVKTTEYNARLVDYQDALEEWRSLNPSQREELDELAEARAIRRYFNGFFLVAGGIEFLLFGALFHDFLSFHAVLSYLATLLVYLAIRRYGLTLAGRSIRAITFGLWIGIIGCVVGAVIGQFFHSRALDTSALQLLRIFDARARSPQTYQSLATLLGAVGFGLGIWFEVRGSTRSSGRPVRPSPPKH